MSAEMTQADEEQNTIEVGGDVTEAEDSCPHCGEDVRVQIERWATTAGDSCPHCGVWVSIERQR